MAATFVENAVDMDMLATLTADDRKEIGGTALGHRKKLLAAIAALDNAGALPAIAPLAASPPAGAERRQLTVMFVDLVGSTAHSARLDPEKMGPVLRGYQNAVAGEIARFEGHVAKFMATASSPIAAGPGRTRPSGRFGRRSRSLPLSPG